jgi:hypothetical protein
VSGDLAADLDVAVAVPAQTFDASDRDSRTVLHQLVEQLGRLALRLVRAMTTFYPCRPRVVRVALQPAASHEGNYQSGMMFSFNVPPTGENARTT